MTTRNGARPTCCYRLVRRPGRICWPGRCSLSNCSGPPRSLPTTLITAKDKAMRRLALALLLCPLLTASAIAQQGGEPFGAALKAALAEQAHADAETARLEQAAAKAQTEAGRLHAQQLAAAQAIEAAEARIGAADAKGPRT